MGKKLAVAALIAVAFLAGAVFGWWIQGRQTERDARLVSTVRSAEVAGLCANALGATQDGRPATAQKLLEMRMVAAVTEAAENVGNASRPRFPVPELIESVKRARRYALAKGMPEVVEKCDRVLAFLANSNERA